MFTGRHFGAPTTVGTGFVTLSHPAIRHMAPIGVSPIVGSPTPPPSFGRMAAPGSRAAASVDAAGAADVADSSGSASVARATPADAADSSGGAGVARPAAPEEKGRGGLHDEENAPSTPRTPRGGGAKAALAARLAQAKEELEALRAKNLALEKSRAESRASRRRKRGDSPSTPSSTPATPEAPMTPPSSGNPPAPSSGRVAAPLGTVDPNVPRGAHNSSKVPGRCYDAPGVGVGARAAQRTGAKPRSILGKVLVVGNAKCGKTSLIRRLVSGEFQDSYKCTVGADFVRKDLDLVKTQPEGVYKRPEPESTHAEANVDDEGAARLRVRMQIWDIAGQDRFARLTRAYFRRARAAAVVCDVTREGTLEAVVQWKRELDSWASSESEGQSTLPVVLFANKSDLLTNAKESFVLGARMEQLCRKHGFAAWFVTSARGGVNVDEGFMELAELIAANDPHSDDPRGGAAARGLDAVSRRAASGAAWPGAGAGAGTGAEVECKVSGPAVEPTAQEDGREVVSPLPHPSSPTSPASPSSPPHPAHASMAEPSARPSTPRVNHYMQQQHQQRAREAGGHLLLPMPRGWEVNLPTAPASIRTKAKTARLMSSVSHVSQRTKSAAHALVQVWDLDDME